MCFHWKIVPTIGGGDFRRSRFRSILSGFWAKICLCLQCSIFTCCVVSEQKSPKKIRYVMKLLYFLDVLLFFQNVKFCSRRIPVFLDVRLCHVPMESHSASKRKIRIQTLYCLMKHGRGGPTDRRLNIYVRLNINTLSHKHFIIGVLFYPRPVLAFGYCRCLRVCVCVCACVCPSIISLSVQ